MTDWGLVDNKKVTKQHAGHGESFILTSGYLGQGNLLQLESAKITSVKDHAI